MIYLPIDSIKAELIAAVQIHKKAVITAPTGTGKSTRVPQFLLDECKEITGQIIVLQPRRIAARHLAKRVSQERRTPLGGEVGYQVRFDEKASVNTRILFMTEGLYWRRLIDDPELRGVSAIVFDEFHERHLDGDLAFARTTEIQKTTRPDLILTVMSATLDVNQIKDYLFPCGTIHCDGVMHPVKLMYSEDGWGIGSRPVWERVCKQLPKVLKEMPEGNILIFMPGAFEINKTVESLGYMKETRGMEIVALHGEMPPEQQDKAISSGTRRKIIVSTNVAETSLTIEGIRAVIDSGLAKVAKYDSGRGVNGLMTERISQSSADQRKGRAGRIASGICMRLWKESETPSLPLNIEPEIFRLDLAPGILELHASGVCELDQFQWFQHPGKEAIENSENLLINLGAIEGQNKKITVEGRKMAKFPMHPRHARILLESEKRGCLGLVIQLVALIQGRSILVHLKDTKKEKERQDRLKVHEMPGSDFFYLYRAFCSAIENGFSPEYCRRMGIHGVTARETWQIAKQFIAVAKRYGLNFGEESTHTDLNEAKKCLMTGFPDHIAKKIDRGTLRYRLPGNRTGELRKCSVADNSELLVVAELEERKKQSSGREMFIGLATEIEEEWLAELWPDRFTESFETIFDEQSRRVVCKHRKKFGDLVIEEKILHEPPDESKAAEILAEKILNGDLILKNWDHETDQWFERVNFCAENLKEYGISKIEHADRLLILSALCHGYYTYKEIKHLEILPILKTWLPEEMRKLIDLLAPSQIEVPGRNKPVAINYSNKEAKIALTVQELINIQKHPCIANNNYRLIVEVLAPNRRPVQITNNIVDFFDNSYQIVRKELKGRYPKHNWPESVKLL